MTTDPGQIPHRIGFLGAGRMATALASGFVKSGLTAAGSILAADVAAAARTAFTNATGSRALESNADVVRESDVVFLAVKPQHAAEVLNDVRDAVAASHLLVSIAAGIPVRSIAAILPGETRIIRVMPNTPCLVGAGAAAFAIGAHATADDAALVERLLSTVGLALRVDESLLDAVTGLSGSGPAFVYQAIEALSDGGVRMGLPRNVALQLAAQTVLGAARMILETGEHPGVLKDAVTSPGGTTIAGLHALERGGLRAALIDAVEAAARRSEELGKST